jgi:hypothetical protein
MDKIAMDRQFMNCYEPDLHIVFGAPGWKMLPVIQAVSQELCAYYAQLIAMSRRYSRNFSW